MTVTMHKFKVDLDESQQYVVVRTMGCCRFVYNHFLALNHELCREGKKPLSCGEMHARLCELMRKNEYLWIQEADMSSLDEVLKDLNHHICCYCEGKGDYPQLMSKKAGCQSYRIWNRNEEIAANGCVITLPGIGSVTLKQTLPSEGKILYATVFRTSSNHYFICMAIETQNC